MRHFRAKSQHLDTLLEEDGEIHESPKTFFSTSVARRLGVGSAGAFSFPGSSEGSARVGLDPYKNTDWAKPSPTLTQPKF